MSEAAHVPEGVVERLPVYLSALIQVRQEGHPTVSSARLGKMTGVNPAQIRRDLTYFGSFGRRGVGYEVVMLIDRIQRILGSDHIHRIALVGAGHLGSAIASYPGLKARGFQLSAIFDNDQSKIGKRIGDFLVQDVSSLARVVAEQRIRIGVIAVPASAAQGVADMLAAAGVVVMLNYSSTMVSAPDGVILHNTDPVRELMHTLYYLSRTDVESATV
ncbi:MAG: redox-sensing transcriptional repressor Rex [Actinobacteria bacterium]|nr:redox-sensing transcriptional repressor Rex [Actinomycetota bacterium]MCL5888304.1 redox-sensing transcriptional repressor Rex [Actinomycetota bacterium]